MSQMSVATTVAKRSTEGSRRTSLRVVTPEQQAGSAWFPVMCVALLLAGLGAVLGLNTAMAQDSFRVAALEAETAKLSDTQNSLEYSINARSAPQRLATEAETLGMVPGSSAAFIDLEREAILGVATEAKKSDRTTVDAAQTATADEPASGSSSSATDSEGESAATDGTNEKSDATDQPEKSETSDKPASSEQQDTSSEKSSSAESESESDSDR